MARPLTPAQEAHIRQMASLGGKASAAAKKAKGENAFGRGGQGAPVARSTPTAKPATADAHPNNLARRDGPTPISGPSGPARGRGASKARPPHVAARHTPAGHMAAPKAHTAPKAPRAHTAQPVARPPAHAPKAARSTMHKSFAGSARGKGK